MPYLQSLCLFFAYFIMFILKLKIFSAQIGKFRRKKLASLLQIQTEQLENKNRFSRMQKKA